MSVIQIKENKDFSKIIDNAKNNLVILKFSAIWCNPCKIIKPIYNNLAILEKDCIFTELDMDNKNIELLITKFSVISLPTFIFIKNKNIIDKIEGANQDELEKKNKKI